MIRPQSKSLSILLALIALFFGLFLLASLDRSLIEGSIARSRGIEAQFVAAAAFVDEFRATNHRLPSQEEFGAWISSSKDVQRGNPLMLWGGPFDVETEAQGGKAPPNGYVIAYWRGEWMERYFSWTRQSTLHFDPDAYFFFHSQLAQVLLAIGVVLLFSAGSVWCWPRKRRAA